MNTAHVAQPIPQKAERSGPAVVRYSRDTMKFLLIVGLIGALVWLARRASAGKAGLDASSEAEAEKEQDK